MAQPRDQTLMPTPTRSTMIRATSLVVLVLSTALFAFFSVTMLTALWHAPELTDYSGSYIAIAPAREVLFLATSSFLALVSLLLWRASSSAGLVAAMAASTISLALLLVNLVLYAGVKAGLFDRLGA